jgi:arylsulfatase A-like enzyme
MTNRPNLIWIFGDQHRAQALGYRGDPNVCTPNIDNLAREGMRFDNAVAGAPWCCPFRAALLTGRYPHQVGVVGTPGALDPAIPTLTAPLKAAGYHTAWIGKWHLDGSNSSAHFVAPERRGGFDYWLGYENNNNQNLGFVYGTGQETPFRLPGYETDSLTDLFLDHIGNHVGVRHGKRDPQTGYNPFFAVLSVQPPHSPYVPPTNPACGQPPRNPAAIQLRRNVPDVPWVQEKARLDLAGYYGMIENIDHNIGRIRQRLKDWELDRDTWIVFFSDHGDMLGSHAQWEKSSPWEESIRIPFIIARAGGEPLMRRGRCDAVLNHVDIAPTTLGLCGLPLPAEMVGHDYSAHCIHPKNPLYRGEPDRATEPDSAYLQQIPRKFHRHSVNKSWRGVVFRDGWKYVCTPGNDWLLHNTAEDKFEQANYVHDIAFKEQRARCHTRLAQWIQHTGDPFDLPEF